MNFNLPARLCVFTLFALFAATPAAAERPSLADGGEGSKHERRSEERRMDRQNDYRHELGRGHFDENNRRIVNDYYGARFRAGKCPRGLDRKNNGCFPPGHARHWAKGQPLPPHMRRYGLPNELLVRLPAPPHGHRYVRVATDILLIAIGTSLVVDAIEDIGR